MKENFLQKNKIKNSQQYSTRAKKKEGFDLPRNTIPCKFLEAINDNGPNFGWILADFVCQSGADVEELYPPQMWIDVCGNEEMGRTFPDSILHFRAPVLPLLRPLPGA